MCDLPCLRLSPSIVCPRATHAVGRVRPPPFQGRVIFPSVDRRCCLSPCSVAGPCVHLISPQQHFNTRTDILGCPRRRCSEKCGGVPRKFRVRRALTRVLAQGAAGPWGTNRSETSQARLEHGCVVRRGPHRAHRTRRRVLAALSSSRAANICGCRRGAGGWGGGGTAGTG